MSQVPTTTDRPKKKELKQRTSEMSTDLRDGGLIQKMRDMQTELLRAFSGWARPVEIKLRTLPMIEERLARP